jgi:ABC-type uncharacterized transport system ATPase subunit
MPNALKTPMPHHRFQADKTEQIVAEHLAFALSDNACVIAEGRLFTEGSPAELAAMPEIRQAYLGLYREPGAIFDREKS